APKIYKIKIGNKNVNRYDKLIRQNPSNPLNLRLSAARQVPFHNNPLKRIYPKKIRVNPLNPRHLRLSAARQVPF
ncbi:MAG TPA: hypothetical protein PLU02_16120, partial [Chitinophagales bacterium]|nr:hypothetical protein [Chitinophagales bacterium]